MFLVAFAFSMYNHIINRISMKRNNIMEIIKSIISILEEGEREKVEI